MPGTRRAPAGCIEAPLRGPAMWRTASDTRISPSPAAAASPLATITGVPYWSSAEASGSPASMPACTATPSFPPVSDRCIATAQATAAAAPPNATVRPAPVERISLPPCVSTASRNAATAARRTGSAASSPACAKNDAAPAMSATRIATKGSSTAPSSRVRLRPRHPAG